LLADQVLLLHQGRHDNTRMRVVAVVLAAGEGSRMGGPKALLRVGPLNFLDMCLRALDRPRVGAAVVVVGHRAAEVRALVPPRGTPTVVENPAYGTGMLSSVLAGLDAAAALAADAVLLHPVDHPRVEV